MTIHKGLFATVPIVLAGSLAMSATIAAPAQASENKRPAKARHSATEEGQTLRQAIAAAAVKSAPVVTTAAHTSAAIATSRASTTSTTSTTSSVSTATASSSIPQTYTVVEGDTVSDIAGRYGLSTASVLAANGLGWKSTIFPGQKLTLTKVAKSSGATAKSASTTTANKRYTIRSGDTVSSIAAHFDVSTKTILSANGLGPKSIIFPGQTLAIPRIVSSPTIEPAVAKAPITAKKHQIATGDTITSVASHYGVTVQSILDANKLTPTSIIYPGSTLTIPVITVSTSGKGRITLLGAEAQKNAKTIISVGRALQVGDRGIIIALAAAMQESELLNVRYGHLDSVGLFQQRPSIGWGSTTQLLDTTYAAKLFYGGAHNPNKGVTRGLLDVPGWKKMSITDAAQAVQVSAHPDAYAQWEASATYWLAELG